jgi:hypothetical protein
MVGLSTPIHIIFLLQLVCRTFDMSSTVKRFSDLNIPTIVALEGKKVKITSVLDREIVIHAYSIRKSKFEGDYAKIQFSIPNKTKKYVVFTGSVNIIRQLSMMDTEDLPVLAKITCNDHGFYALS